MNATLDEWIKQEAEILAANKRGCGSGFCTPQQLEGKSGLEILRGMMDGSLPAPYSAKHEGICTVDVAWGSATFQGKPEIQHRNPAGSVHGGWMANLCDSAMGSAVLARLPADKTFYVTAWMSVRYLVGMPASTSRVRCLAKVDAIHPDAREMKASARIVDSEGVCFAEAEGAYKVSRGAFGAGFA